MSLKHQLKSITLSIEQNKQAFKKNKQNINSLENHPPFIRSNVDLKQIKSIVRDNIKSLIKTKQTSTSAYQSVIKHLKLLLQQAWTKNQFLVRDRAEVLKENLMLKDNVQALSEELQEIKRRVCELKLNGYSGNQVNGTFQNGNIFNIYSQESSRLVAEKQHYLIESKQQHSNQYIPHSNQQSQQQQQQEESLLLRQASQQEMLISIGRQNNILSPGQSSQISSQINQTPNYNFKETNFDVDNIRKVPGHFVDVGSKFISYENSYNNSGCINSSNNQVEISLNNMNGELYLPISQNKVVLKQEIETFKEHLRNNAGGQSSGSQQSHTPVDQSHEQYNHQQQYNAHNQSLNHSTSKTQIMTACSSSCEQGLFRSFYLSLLKYPYYRQKIYMLLQQLQHDESFILYNLYPKNSFWTEMVSSFLQFINLNKPSGQYILDHLNSHKLIDLLLIQTLKSRVEYLYNNLADELDESSLLNGSITNERKVIQSNDFDSVNVSVQNINQHEQYYEQQQQQQSCYITDQPSSSQLSHLQIFNALANSFDLNCKPNDKCFDFYDPEHEHEHSQMFTSSQLHEGRSQLKPIFSIVNNEQTSTFVFMFGLQYEQSSTNSQINQSQRRQQLYEYENSVKKQFEDININPSASENTSNLLNSQEKSQQYNNEGSFISQTNEYEDDEECSEQYYSHQIVSENISYHYNETAENTQRSLRSESYHETESMQNHEGMELRERTPNYNTLNNNCPIQEELCETETKSLLSTLTNSHLLSKLSSRQPSSQVSRVKEQRYKKEKQQLTYNREDIFDENFMRRKVNSVESEDDEVLTDEKYDTQQWIPHCRIR